jgi:hypothetical protein
MEILKLVERAAWIQEHDDIIINTFIKAKNGGINTKTACIAAADHIFELDGTHRTEKAISNRYYNLQRAGKVSPLLFAPDKPVEEEREIDLVGMLSGLKKIIKERDDLKVKYEEALAYKIMYEELKKKLARIEKESYSIMDLMGKK